MIHRVEKYFKCRESFMIEDSPVLKAFESLFDISGTTTLEHSVKIEGSKVYATRFNLHFRHTNMIYKINQVNNFLDNILADIGINLNFKILVDILPWSTERRRKIVWMIVGIDLREKLEDSRVKVWFDIKNWRAQINKVWDLHGRPADGISTHRRDRLLYGVDMKFDGTTKVKVYPYFTCHDFRLDKIAPALLETFGEMSILLMKSCKMVYITYSESGKRTFHFWIDKGSMPNFYYLFCDKVLHVSPFYRVYTKVLGSSYPIQYIALQEDEIEAEKKITNMCIYY